MFAYLIRIALLSLRRNPVLSTLLIAAIALGVAVSTAFVTVYYIYSGNPIPAKSDQLYYVQMDNWNPDRPYSRRRPEMPPEQITYRDMQGIMTSDIPTYQSGMFVASLTVHPPDTEQRPFRERVRMCFSDFFPMFEVPFLYGGGWDRGSDRGPEPVVVIDAATNDRLFGGGNSVGKTVRIEDRPFTVTGVLAPWRPSPRFYDPHTGPNSVPEGIYMPFEFVRVFEVETAGNLLIWTDLEESAAFEEFLASEAIWIQMWVQLDTAEQRQVYSDFLDAYVMEQKKLGRFGRPLNNRLLDVMQWLEDQEVVPEEATGMLVISLLFLLVCAVNLIGILLGKFLARAPEVGVRRALGASRASVFLQHIVECELVGIIGGVIGLGLSALCLGMINRLLDNGDQFGLDLPMVAAGIGLSLVAGLVAGLYPAWRICRMAPAIHLKLQ
jgi:putative ABC transport system permease protein